MSEVQQYAAHKDGRAGGAWTLAAAGAAALLASSCCLLPLLLVSVGFSGAWLGNLRVLQPYSPILTGIAVIALVFAGQSLRRPTSCRAGSAASRSLYKAAFWLVAALTLTLLVTPLVAPWFY
jgi:mercuric ion transport protein